MLNEFRKSIWMLLPDGTKKEAQVVGSEEDDGIAVLCISYADAKVSQSSSRGFFDALKKIRLILETEGVLPLCFGASEDVYPSPMQESMGMAMQAYRNQFGRQALSADIVDIFDSDDRMRPATVNAQEKFHLQWLESL
ncbi:hypothetical protein [Andreprevotia chitinilytica]|uniref:hypothetical protein n=1 Tax=Andreprevotia chitinilytica TaxID=396808 RepID=UPI0006920A3E|nr:hypothetical protein [Andreprevotia chitinilytica]